MKTLLLTATLKEAKSVIEKGKFKKEREKPFYLFKAQNVDLVITGVGKTCAAAAASFALSNSNYSRIVLFGLGGSYPGSFIDIGEVVAAEKEIYGDEGVCQEGYLEPIEGIPTIFDMEVPELDIKKGDFVTLSCIPGSTKLVKRIKESFPNAICENMEGAAVAHVAQLFNRKVIEIRAISNFAGERDKRKWDTEKAIKNLTEIIISLLRGNK